LIAIYLLSLRETETERNSKNKYLSYNSSIAFRGLMLFRNDDGSFRRIGTFQVWTGLINPKKQKDSGWVFRNVPRTCVTFADPTQWFPLLDEK